ncbi:hypothetical protein [Leptolyngbya sp. 7M]|uniref:hypothetical protein n=1 Tax=Leptolyngbya sp. 7M TaxID=2812896 RepID=UPI001B8CF5A4|nr:hypothetical protein [Leptolyngbya sp. 7M]QYO62462.1 hypothetical protein JVX88_20550 [Leptolyngbya sp. 7M]
MTYGNRLRRWIVVRLSSNLQHVDVARFLKYADAEGYRQILRRIDPTRRYEIMFDAGEQDTETDYYRPCYRGYYY